VTLPISFPWSLAQLDLTRITQNHAKLPRENVISLFFFFGNNIEPQKAIVFLYITYDDYFIQYLSWTILFIWTLTLTRLLSVWHIHCRRLISGVSVHLL